MTGTAADCHAHVFDPARYPYRAGAPYIPGPCQAGTPEDLLAVLDAHGFSHALIVGAAPYGTDNRCLLDAIARSRGRFKGIALLEPDAGEARVRELAEGGVVGVRVNLVHDGVEALLGRAGARLLAVIREAGWFCELQYEKDQLLAVAPVLEKARVRLIVDHCGRPDPGRGLAQPGFQTLLALARTTEAVVKLSGPFRFSRAPYPYADADPFVEALLGAFGLERCVWGSDWPFVRLDRRIDYGPTLACLRRWIPQEEARRKVVWETPARLFGFGGP